MIHRKSDRALEAGTARLTVAVAVACTVAIWGSRFAERGARSERDDGASVKIACARGAGDPEHGPGPRYSDHRIGGLTFSRGAPGPRVPSPRGAQTTESVV